MQTSKQSTEPVANTVAWVKTSSRDPLWPALIMAHDNKPPQLLLVKKPQVPFVPVVYYGTREVAYIPISNLLLPFDGDNFEKFGYPKKGTKQYKQLSSAIKEAAETPDCLVFDYRSAGLTLNNEDEQFSDDADEVEELKPKKRRRKSEGDSLADSDMTDRPKRAKRKASEEPDQEEQQPKKSRNKRHSEGAALSEQAPVLTVKSDFEKLKALRHKLQKIFLGSKVLVEEFRRVDGVMTELEQFQPDYELLKSTKIIKVLKLVSAIKFGESEPANVIQRCNALVDKWKSLLMNQEQSVEPELQVDIAQDSLEVHQTEAFDVQIVREKQEEPPVEVSAEVVLPDQTSGTIVKETDIQVNSTQIKAKCQDEEVEQTTTSEIIEETIYALELSAKDRIDVEDLKALDDSVKGEENSDRNSSDKIDSHLNPVASVLL